MIVLDAARDAEARRRAEICALDDDALREDDAGMRFGARDGIADRTAVDLDELAASQARVDAVERELVRDANTARAPSATSSRGFPTVRRPCLRRATSIAAR